ncbi:hypothetical protein HaLaN_16718 [Haematococcus lacustris]|uniref:Uncharacterized protein n=1 Tax=Haematococcus lacustris TaxID=44745 RepID=A0A699ZEN3_HAELA|nr:hypothetical protein HaLaN_16718 [Haematococcus lacustris]
MGAASVATTTASAAVAASEARRSGEEHSSLMQALLLALAEAPAEEQADDAQTLSSEAVRSDPPCLHTLKAHSSITSWPGLLLKSHVATQSTFT